MVTDPGSKESKIIFRNQAAEIVSVQKMEAKTFWESFIFNILLNQKTDLPPVRVSTRTIRSPKETPQADSYPIHLDGRVRKQVKTGIGQYHMNKKQRQNISSRNTNQNLE